MWIHLFTLFVLHIFSKTHSHSGTLKAILTAMITHTVVDCFWLGDLHLLCHFHISADSSKIPSGDLWPRLVWLLHHQASCACVCVCWWGWTGLKCPSLRLCTLLGPGEQYSRHRRTDWEAAALLNDGKPDTLLPPHPLTHTKTHSHSFLLCFFCCCGLNYSSSFVAFRVTNSAAAA